MRTYGWIALTVVAADQLTKAAAVGLGEETVVLVPGVLGLHYAQNTGMAFGLFSGMPWLLGILSLIAVCAGLWAIHRRPLRPWPMISAMLMVGGAVGNMIDRLVQGYVVDMVEILCFRFAIFNLADAALTIGCAAMAVSLLFRPSDWSDKKHGAANDDVL